MAHTPTDISLVYLYLPPFFLDLLAGVVLAWAIGRLLNRTGLSRFVWHPPLAFLALTVLMTSLVGLLVLPP
jgi:hypothetical protein